MRQAIPAPIHRFCVAPMMARTDCHGRYLMRLLSRRAMLYSEMITSDALIHGNSRRLLARDEIDAPQGAQLGGSNPQELARCARLIQDAGYDEINLNLGCPSARVQYREIGACLMRAPRRVAECVRAMSEASSLPVTVKCRIAVDESPDAALDELVERVAEAGARCFMIHARTAILDGLNPKQNRNLPPLRYERVYQLKLDFPELNIVINGGINSLEECLRHLEHVDGVMLGRAIYRNLWLLSKVDSVLFGEQPRLLERATVLRRFAAHLDAQNEGNDTNNVNFLRHALGLFHGIGGGRGFRRALGRQLARSATRSAHDIAEAALSGALPN